MNTLFGIKGTMTQTFIEGFRIPVTKVKLGPCTVTQIKTSAKDGYTSIQLSLGTKKKEIRLAEESDYKVGDIINASDIFKKGDVVDAIAITKGKGFQGGVRRFNFKGGPKTHGQSDRHRAPGSIGQTTTPGRVYKGKRMAGRMGGTQVTIKNLHIINLNQDNNEVLISGALPGRTGAFISIKRIKAGSLKELEHEVVAQVVETEAPAEIEIKEEVKNEKN